jgi:hypothetical protein
MYMCWKCAKDVRMWCVTSDQNASDGQKQVGWLRKQKEDEVEG